MKGGGQGGVPDNERYSPVPSVCVTLCLLARGTGSIGFGGLRTDHVSRRGRSTAPSAGGGPANEKPR